MLYIELFYSACTLNLGRLGHLGGHREAVYALDLFRNSALDHLVLSHQRLSLCVGYVE